MNDSIEDKVICIICLDEIDEKNIINKEESICRCIEKIHNTCLNQWLKINNSCPLCRKQLKLIEEETLNELQPQHPYYNEEEIELIEIYEDRRIRLQKVKYLLRLAFIILITSIAATALKIIQQIVNLF